MQKLLNEKINEIINSPEFQIVFDFLQVFDSVKELNGKGHQAAKALQKLKSRLLNVLKQYVESVSI